MAEYHLRHLLCAQRRAFPPLRFHLNSSVHTISSINHVRASPSASKSVSRNIPNRARDLDQHDHLGLRTIVGPGLGDLCMGTMVDRQRDGTSCLLPPYMGDVCAAAWYTPSANSNSMSHRRGELAEMTALYFIPILSVVIAATSGALVARALTNNGHQLWTLIISYVFWGIGTPMSWIIMTLYFLRMTVHKPLEREVIVSLLLPIGPLGLSGFSYVHRSEFLSAY